MRHGHRITINEMIDKGEANLMATSTERNLAPQSPSDTSGWPHLTTRYRTRLDDEHVRFESPRSGAARVARSGPPAYAWDWFARQRLLWREVRSRLAAGAAPLATRYAAVDTRAETMPLLRTDYARDELVRSTVDGVVAEIAFLGRIDDSFERLGLHNAPRGLRWWWTALSGEEIDRPAPAPRSTGSHAQLSLDELADQDPRLAMDEVHEGYGG